MQDHHSFALLALLAALGMACSSSSSDPPGEASGTRVVLGTGKAEYEPFVGEAHVPLISGIQGGFHVWSSFITYGFETDVLRIDLQTSTDGEPDSALEMSGNVAIKAALDPDGMPVLASLGWPASISNPKCADGRRLRFDITVLDRGTGQTASDTAYCIVDVAEEYRATECGD
jgi:hypothetical protein